MPTCESQAAANGEMKMEMETENQIERNPTENRTAMGVRMSGSAGRKQNSV